MHDLRLRTHALEALEALLKNLFVVWVDPIEVFHRSILWHVGRLIRTSKRAKPVV